MMLACSVGAAWYYCTVQYFCMYITSHLVGRGLLHEVDGWYVPDGSLQAGRLSRSLQYLMLALVFSMRLGLADTHHCDVALLDGVQRVREGC